MKFRITVALVLVIALQSLVGVIDASRPHHPAVIHEGHDHEHSSQIYSHGAEHTNPDPVEMAKNLVADSSDHNIDHASSHCHFNHVHFHIVPMAVAANVAVMCTSQKLPDVPSGQPSSTSRTPFRPPIA